MLTESWAEAINRQTGLPVVVTAGIHYDGVNGADIAEIMEIIHFERGNGLISTNNNNIMVEFKASPLEKDLITTDRRELRNIVNRLRQQDNQASAG